MDPQPARHVVSSGYEKAPVSSRGLGVAAASSASAASRRRVFAPPGPATGCPRGHHRGPIVCARLGPVNSLPLSSSPMALPTQSDDFPAWYQEVVKQAGLAENSLARGTMVIKPYGFGIWEAI